jgi:Uncharacterized conserved protein
MSLPVLKPSVAAARPAAAYARAPLLDKQVTAADGFAVILHECLYQISANAAAAEDGDSEGLHQLRIGFRRFRSAISAFGKDQPQLKTLSARAKAVTLAIGPARDLDVFLTSLFDPAVAALGPQPGFALLRVRAERLRRKAWADAVQAITESEFSILQNDIADAATLWKDMHQPLGDAVPPILQRLRRKARKRHGKIDAATPAERHALRIALKKLRYTAEFFAPLYRARQVARFMAPLKALQDHLGALNDGAQMRILLSRAVMEDGTTPANQAELSHASGLLLGWHQAQSQRLLRKTATGWAAFHKADAFW